MCDCSHVLVFAAWDEYNTDCVYTVYDYNTDERGLPRARFDSYTTMHKGMHASQTKEQHFEHAACQTYIALGLALTQAAELKIDSIPAEGFNNQRIDEVLALHEMGLKSTLLMYLGYSDNKNDWLAHIKKVRIPMDELVIR